MVDRNPDSETSSSPDTSLVFSHKSANFMTYFKNKSVLETFFNHSRQSSNPSAEWSWFFDTILLFLMLFLVPKFKFEFQKGYLFNANSYFAFTSLNYPHSLLLSHVIVVAAAKVRFPCAMKSMFERSHAFFECQFQFHFIFTITPILSWSLLPWKLLNKWVKIGCCH